MNAITFFLGKTTLCSVTLLATFLTGCATAPSEPQPVVVSQAYQANQTNQTAPTYVVKRASIRTPSSERFTAQHRVQADISNPTQRSNRPSYAQPRVEERPVFRKASINRATTNNSANLRKFYQQRYETDLRRKEAQAEQQRAGRIAEIKRERAEKANIANMRRHRVVTPVAKRKVDVRAVNQRANQDKFQAAAHKVESVIQSAARQIGKRYAWGGSSPSTGFDCSGLVQHSIKAGANIRVPRTAAEQYAVAVKVNSQQATRGDLVFFNTSGRRVSHVGIYLGGNKFLHAPSAGKTVTTSNISGYWRDRLIGFGRIPGACHVPV